MKGADPRLQRLLGGEALAGLRRRLRRRYEHALPDSQPDTLRLNALADHEREALALLSGRPPSASRSIALDLNSLDRALRDAGIAGSLREALEQLDGPILNLHTLRAESAAGWSAVLAACTHPGLAGWLQSPLAFGRLKRLARQDVALGVQLVVQAGAVLRRLPAVGMPRAQLAADALGNAHALDGGRPTAALVLAAWRAMESSTGEARPPDDDDAEATEERVRDVWARAGVLVNELARPALCLNLPVSPDRNDRVALDGEPAYLSLRRLLRAPPAWSVAGKPVFVCENPNLVAIAADQLGPRCAPLVCVEGMPAAAQRTLLTQLTEAGALLRYHGDFDWPGLQIGNHVMRSWQAVPWAFGARDYEVAATHAPHLQRDLAHSSVVASWDPDLAPTMHRHGLAIAEEAVAETMLRDLATSSA